MIERKRQRHRQREKQGPHGEPDVGLYPRTLESHPELKADAQPLSQPGVPRGYHVKGNKSEKDKYHTISLTCGI